MHFIDLIQFSEASICDSIEKKQTLNGHTQTKPNDKIEIKIQMAIRKKPFIVHIGKTEKLKRLACECAEEFKCDITKIRLE